MIKKNPTNHITNWLRNNAIPIHTTLAGQGFEDLRPLAKLFPNVSMVALGEATHGSKEFLQLKHRIFEFLASEFGFTTLGLESHFSECTDIDRYLLTANGNPIQIMALDPFSLYWNNAEILSLIEWMHQYNENIFHPQKLRFYGFDMQYTGNSVLALFDYFTMTDPSYAVKLKTILQPISSGYPRHKLSVLPLPEIKKIVQFALSLEGRLELKKRRYIYSTDIEMWTLARYHARLLAQALAKTITEDKNIRELCMAENIQWFMEQNPQTKIVLWAHNIHISFARSSPLPMGFYLKKYFKENLLVVGFAFYQGSFLAFDWSKGPDNSKGLQPCTVGPSPEGSFGEVLDRVGHPIFALDLRNAPEPVASWLKEHLPQWQSGGAFLGKEKALTKCSPAKSYDVLIFVKETTAATKLPEASSPHK